MKKSAMKAVVRDLVAEHDAEVSDLKAEARRRDAEIRRLRGEVQNMKTHWRPVPIAHPWQPKNPQCALCDEPKDALRHTVTSTPVEESAP